MKRRDLERHLRAHGARLLREGGNHSFWGFDAHAYWSADLSNLYAQSFGNTSGLDAFRYSPPIGQLFSFFGAIPWELFFGLYFLFMAAVLWWLGGKWMLALVALPPVTLELYHGNIHLFMALAIYFGFRFPAAWAFVILAKVTPGVGALWFVFRREWKAVAQIALVTGGIVLASWLIAPELWTQYIAAMSDNLAYRPPGGYPFDVPQVIRIPIAIASGDIDHLVVRPGQIGRCVFEPTEHPTSLMARRMLENWRAATGASLDPDEARQKTA